MSRLLLALLLTVSLAASAQLPWRKRLDLSVAFDDPVALRSVRVSYWVKNQNLYVYGTGRVILQTPQSGQDLIPTCRGSVPESRIRQLLQAFEDHHFFDLPDRQFLFLYTSPDPDALQIHTIQIQDSTAWTSRSFAIGTYNGKPETIPDDFAAIEQELSAIRRAAFPKDQVCGLAAPIRGNH